MKIPSLSVPKSLLGMQDIHLLMSFCSVLQEYAWKEIAKPNEAWAKLVKRSVPARELSLV